MTGLQIDDGPPGHRRSAQHLRALEGITEADETALVATVLRDDDTTMAESAVKNHLERRAAELLAGPRFATWAQNMATVIEARGFLTRLREWILLGAMALDEPWAAEDGRRHRLPHRRADRRTASQPSDDRIGGHGKDLPGMCVPRTKKCGVMCHVLNIYASL
ncbi:hypothetical protein [Streptomyces sp. NPDC048428]|uniref:hypothetical protein n=1 Tax=Streptomyces sp. NPDC048428 TaxID=3154503 RepID=UPI00342F568E